MGNLPKEIIKWYFILLCFIVTVQISECKIGATTRRPERQQNYYTTYRPGRGRYPVALPGTYYPTNPKWPTTRPSVNHPMIRPPYGSHLYPSLPDNVHIKPKYRMTTLPSYRRPYYSTVPPYYPPYPTARPTRPNTNYRTPPTHKPVRYYSTTAKPAESIFDLVTGTRYPIHDRYNQTRPGYGPSGGRSTIATYIPAESNIHPVVVDPLYYPFPTRIYNPPTVDPLYYPFPKRTYISPPILDPLYSVTYPTRRYKPTTRRYYNENYYTTHYPRTQTTKPMYSTVRTTHKPSLFNEFIDQKISKDQSNFGINAMIIDYMNEKTVTGNKPILPSGLLSALQSITKEDPDILENIIKKESDSAEYFY